MRTSLRRSMNWLSVLIVIVSLPACITCRHDPKPESAYSYRSISRLPFMGGSLLYDSEHPALSHLSVDRIIPIRLGRVVPEALPQEFADTLPSNQHSKVDLYEYRDDSSAEEFGKLQVTAIGTESISVAATLFDKSGRASDAKTFTLTPDKPVDLNGDGRDDIVYLNSIGSARKSVSGRMYLRFISSRDALNTSMFSYAPDLNRELGVAGGNLGFNDGGAAIIRVDSSSARTFQQGVMPEAGDIIIDVSSGKYRRVTAEAASRAITPLGEASIATAFEGGDEPSLAEVVPVFHMQTTSSDMARRNSQGLSMAEHGLISENEYEYNTVVATYRKQAVSHRLYKRVAIPDGPLQMCGDGFCIGLKNMAIDVGLDADISITWSSAKVSISTIAMAEAFAGLTTSKDVDVANGAKEIKLPGYATTMVIGPVLLDANVWPSIGYMADFELGGGARAGMRVFAVQGGSARASARLSLDASGSAEAYSDSILLPVFDLKTRIGHDSYAYAYAKLHADVGVWKVLRANADATVKIGPQWDAQWLPGSVSVKAKSEISTKLDSAFTATAEIGFPVGPTKKWKLAELLTYSRESTMGRKDYEIAYAGLSDNVRTLALRYPLKDCPRGQVYGAFGECYDPTPPPCDGCNDKPRGMVNVTFRMPKLSTGHDEFMIKGVRDREDIFVRTKGYDLTPAMPCEHQPRQCAELNEVFEATQGPLEIEIWHGTSIFANTGTLSLDGTTPVDIVCEQYRPCRCSMGSSVFACGDGGDAPHH